MNKIIGIIIFKDLSVINKFVDVSWANFWIQTMVTNGIIDTCKDIVQRVNACKITCINFDDMSKEIEYMSDVVCYCYKNQNGLSSIILTKNYKHKRIMTELTYKLINEFGTDTDLAELAKQYEDPISIDKIAKARNEIDKTMDVLHLTIEKVLERGDNIEALVIKTDELSASSDLFFKRSKQLNSCCIIL